MISATFGLPLHRSQDSSRLEQRLVPYTCLLRNDYVSMTHPNSVIELVPTNGRLLSLIRRSGGKDVLLTMLCLTSRATFTRQVVAGNDGGQAGYL